MKKYDSLELGGSEDDKTLIKLFKPSLEPLQENVKVIKTKSKQQQPQATAATAATTSTTAIIGTR